MPHYAELISVAPGNQSHTVGGEVIRDRANAPLVSVVMPAYNAELTIERAIESVILQSVSDWELIVVDDGSSDATTSIVERFAAQDNRVHSLTLAANSGGPATPRNRALECARGRYIAFLDADDIWAPAKLELQLQFMRAHQLDVCGSAVELINLSGDVVGVRKPQGDISFASLLSNNRLILSTVVVAGDWLQSRRFKCIGHEDYLLWLELAQAGAAIGIVPKVLGRYRKRAGSVSANKLKVIAFFWHIYFAELDLPWAKAAFFTVRYLLFATWRAKQELAGRLKI